MTAATTARKRDEDLSEEELLALSENLMTELGRLGAERGTEVDDMTVVKSLRAKKKYGTKSGRAEKKLQKKDARASSRQRKKKGARSSSRPGRLTSLKARASKLALRKFKLSSRDELQSQPSEDILVKQSREALEARGESPAVETRGEDSPGAREAESPGRRDEDDATTVKITAHENEVDVVSLGKYLAEDECYDDESTIVTTFTEANSQALQMSDMARMTQDVKYLEEEKTKKVIEEEMAKGSRSVGTKKTKGDKSVYLSVRSAKKKRDRKEEKQMQKMRTNKETPRARSKSLKNLLGRRKSKSKASTGSGSSRDREDEWDDETKTVQFADDQTAEREDREEDASVSRAREVLDADEASKCYQEKDRKAPGMSERKLSGGLQERLLSFVMGTPEGSSPAASLEKGPANDGITAAVIVQTAPALVMEDLRDVFEKMCAEEESFGGCYPCAWNADDDAAAGEDLRGGEGGSIVGGGGTGETSVRTEGGSGGSAGERATEDEDDDGFGEDRSAVCSAVDVVRKPSAKDMTIGCLYYSSVATRTRSERGSLYDL
ncbi:hypothetical protein ACHAWF_005190 [Thalassiosira exigua]